VLFLVIKQAKLVLGPGPSLVLYVTIYVVYMDLVAEFGPMLDEGGNSV
jgi:hypothetical protein